MSTASMSLSGRLPRDPEQRQTASGKIMATASIPLQTEKDGATLWVGLLAFGAQAAQLLEHSKGDQVSVMGRVSVRAYQDQARVSLLVDQIISARPKPVRPQPQPDHEAMPF